ncbi:MAG: MaoC family dehydratase [Gammaproteobacteria bacterium]|nr:MaoC family dehydratase [Gammaproteobacteria bacterium]
MPKTVSLEEFRDSAGRELPPSHWFEITQERVNRFADATEDHQFIHIDPERAAETPFGGTIAHGFLTLSLLPHLTSSIPTRDPKAYEGMVMGVNYGLDKVRFPAPVPVNSKLRAERTLLEAELKAPNTIQLKQQITVEIEGGKKPACVAEFLTRLIFA